MSTLILIVLTVIAAFSPNMPIQKTEAAIAAVKSDAKIQEVNAQKELSLSPDRLIIPAIGVNARVRGMGLTAQGKMAVPNNFTEVGWYELGAAPGKPGTAVMGAHVDNGGRISGVFKNLKKLKVGNLITIHDTKGGILKYKVVSRKVYARDTKDTTAVFASSEKPRLNLITCHGTWLPKENTYSGRLVVSAELISAVPAVQVSKI